MKAALLTLLVDNWRAARRIALTGQNEELASVTFKGGTGQYNVRYGQAA